jgi:hypothetical protein
MSFQSWSLPHALERRVRAEGTHAAGVERARLDPAASRSLLDHLRRARTGLLARPVREVARALGRAASRFLDDGDELRREALERIPGTAGFSAAMARVVLDGMAADWTSERLEGLLDRELGGGAALDGFVSVGNRRSSRALGLPLTVHLCAGSVPGVSVTSMVRALLVKSAVLLKPGRGDEVLPVLFRRALMDEARWLSEAVAVVYWPGGCADPLEAAALAEADLLVVYGGDAAVQNARAAARATTPVVAYPHRVSFAVVGGEARQGAAPSTARAVSLFDQRGCVSPQLIYVLGSEESACRFAESLAGELRQLEEDLPAGPLEERAAAALHQIRGTAELLSAAGRGRAWSGGERSWTVVLDPDPAFEPSCLGRVVRVKPIAGVDALLEVVRPFRRHLQTVGTGGLSAGTRMELAEGLARLGPVRVATLESAPWPPPWWNHDGMGPLTSLVRWSDLEEDAE